MNVWYVNSILGTFRLEEENDAICGLTLCPDGVPELEPLPRKVCETPLLQEAEEQLNEYFAGARREFDLPLAPKGTPFQKAVWAEMNKIPYGETRTYGPGRGRSLQPQPHCHPAALPPGDGQYRQTHRLRLRAGNEAVPAGTGTGLSGATCCARIFFCAYLCYTIVYFKIHAK